MQKTFDSHDRLIGGIEDGAPSALPQLSCKEAKEYEQRFESLEVLELFELLLHLAAGNINHEENCPSRDPERLREVRERYQRESKSQQM